MRRTENIILTAIVALLTVACSSDEAAGTAADEPQAIQFRGGIGDMVLETRAGTGLQATAFEPNTRLGIYVNEQTTAYQTVPEAVYENPMIYSVWLVDGILRPVNGKYPYFPMSGNGVKVCAVYPESALTTTQFSVADDQSLSSGYLASDLMFATAETERTSDPVYLSFKHQLSKLVVNLIPADDEVDLSKSVITVKGVRKSIVSTPETATLGSVSGVAGDIKATSDGSKPCAVILPPQKKSGQLLEIALIAGDVLKVTLKSNEALTMEGGKVYTINVPVTVDRTLTVLDLTATDGNPIEVADWEDDHDPVPTLTATQVKD